MEYVAHNCPNCGGRLPTESSNGLYTCEYCGQSVRIKGANDSEAVTNTDASKATLTLTYDASHYLVIPDMKVTVNDKTFTIQNHNKLTLILEKGEYDLKFKSSVRRKTVHLVVDKDNKLQIGWNRVTGKIVVEVAQDSVQYL